MYLALIALVGVERLVELVVSARNTRLCRAAGGVEHGRGHYPAMVALHTAFLVALIAEPALLDRPFLPWLGGPALAVALGAQALRWWTIATLGSRWNTRVFVIPGGARAVGGPFRYLRHPNYLAVVIEGVALPLIHSAWLTCIAFTVLNALLLRVRIRVEDEALRSLR